MEDETTSYKEELLRSVAEKKIKHTVKYIENATDETLKKFTTTTKDKNNTKCVSDGSAYHEMFRTYEQFRLGER